MRPVREKRSYTWHITEEERLKLREARVRRLVEASRRAKPKPVLDPEEEVVPGLKRKHVQEFVEGLIAIRKRWTLAQGVRTRVEARCGLT